MTLHFQSLLSTMDQPELAQLWEGAGIEKVEVINSQKIWRIFVAIPQPITAFDINRTLQRLTSEYPFLNRIEIIPRLNEPERHINWLVQKRKDDLSSFLLSKGIELWRSDTVEYKIQDHRLDLYCSHQETYEKILEQGICTHISDWFWQEYNLQLLVRVLCEKKTAPSEDDHNWAIRRNEEVVIISGDPGNKNKRLRGRDKKVREDRIHDEAMTVKDIQEGLKTAVVEGEIWNLAINTLRDGRLAVSYYLTDYQDSIILKLFLNNENEHIFKVGDWVKVKGGVRYDPFIKEIALFVEQYEFPARNVRLDDYPDKRVELHAHTKMSSMDGLTEIEALIKRAAEWGHPAVAITDHGCVQSYPEAYSAARKNKIKIIYGVEGYLVEEDKKERSYHIVILARNEIGLRNLYRLVSLSYLKHFYRKPRIPRSELVKYREGLLLGTACEAGELYRAIIRGEEESRLEAIAGFYDYLEVQPLDNNRFLLKDKVESEERLIEFNRRIVAMGKKFNKPVVATGDVHFLDPQDEIFRSIIQAGQGYSDSEAQAPLYFRTTREMLDEFSYLGEEDARWVVIDGPARVAGWIDNIKPVPDGFYPPQIESAEAEITQLSWENAYARYGRPLPALVEERIKKELAAITKHGYAVLYLIAHKLVRRSNQDGYMVGSRGSVGSSLVAFLTGITEVNALEPHYVCPHCFYSEFFTDGSIGCGADLPEKDCPQCGQSMQRDGFDIPFETFLGFDGDKIPDIDLNFSGDYQSKAHQYVEELFGKENVFRAGTISTIADKTAYGFVKKYEEAKDLHLRNSEIERLVQGITGVRRTTGQHPGGLIVVPRDRDIMEFTPLQHPADNKESGIITTHFDYHAIGDQLVKLDILGHDNPTVIKEMEDLTGVKYASISLSDPETMRLFSGVEPLHINPEDIDSGVGTYGIPEFGTRFVRQILEFTRPTSISELVRICGLSHGTDVWLNNAHTLIDEGTASLVEVICNRDDIMGYLIHEGVDKTRAFKIMEMVRKGKGLDPDNKNLLTENHIPEWFIESCEKIKYLFPKAHAAAYVVMSFKIAWYKIYHPLAFYASFFSIRAEDFDAQTILGGYEAVRQRIKDIEKMGQSAPQKEKKLVTILELAREMYARGFEFYPVDIYRSDSRRFLVAEQGLILPFSALPNIGLAAAEGIIKARAEGEFISVEDFQIRSHLNKSGMDVLRKENCFHGLPENTQISLFA